MPSPALFQLHHQRQGLPEAARWLTQRWPRRRQRPLRVESPRGAGNTCGCIPGEPFWATRGEALGRLLFKSLRAGTRPLVSLSTGACQEKDCCLSFSTSVRSEGLRRTFCSFTACLCLFAAGPGFLPAPEVAAKQVESAAGQGLAHAGAFCGVIRVGNG